MAKTSKESDLFKGIKPVNIPAPREQELKPLEPVNKEKPKKEESRSIPQTAPKKPLESVSKKEEVKTEAPIRAEEKGSINRGGRPLEYTEKPKQLKLLLTPEQYTFLRDNGGKYGGMTKYIQRLVQEEMNKA